MEEDDDYVPAPGQLKPPEVTTSKEIDERVLYVESSSYGYKDGWYFLDECQQCVGPYDTRGQAIDAMLVYEP